MQIDFKHEVMRFEELAPGDLFLTAGRDSRSIIGLKMIADNRELGVANFCEPKKESGKIPAMYTSQAFENASVIKLTKAILRPTMTLDGARQGWPGQSDIGALIVTKTFCAIRCSMADLRTMDIDVSEGAPLQRNTDQEAFWFPSWSVLIPDANDEYQSIFDFSSNA